MRRSRQQISDADCLEILKRGSHGILALNGENFPYAVPLSFVLDESGSKIYFHCALEGFKLDLIRQNSHASFCVVDCDEVIEEKFTTKYRSVICFGKIRFADDSEKRLGLELLGKKYSTSVDEKSLDAEIDRGFDRCLVPIFEIENLTGKQAIEFLKR